MADSFALVVVRAFASHAIGDRIDEPDGMAHVLAGEHAHHVVRVAATEQEH